MNYTRVLKYRLPLVRGEDVLFVQRRLRSLQISTGHPDGIFGPSTEGAVKRFQQSKGLRPDGIVGPQTWSALFADGGDEAGPPADKIVDVIDDLTRVHQYRASIKWQLTPSGISLEGKPPAGTGGEPQTVARVWNDFGTAVEHWAKRLNVPVELIVATICTESGGNPTVVREEPKYESDEQTPHQVSPGLMQTLISTARAAVGDDTIDRSWLLEPANSIQAGTAYIASQWKSTSFDPPKVACAYNAGGVYYNDGVDNRWKMRQYPIGTGKHADRFVQWFNDCMRYFDKHKLKPETSFYTVLNPQA